MRRKIEKDEGYAEGELVESWSGKRILVGFVVLVMLIGAGYLFLSKATERASKVLGTNSSVLRVTQDTSEVRLPNKEDADALLEKAKSELNNLTSEKVSSSPGTLQKIISDLQKVQSGKESPVGVLCDLVCKK